MKFNRKFSLFFLVPGFLLLGGAFGLSFVKSPFSVTEDFNGERALNDVKVQVDFGPRLPDSLAHSQTIDYIQAELSKAGWHSQILEQEFNGIVAYNLLATRNSPDPVLLFGAHYDSRLVADADPVLSNRLLPVPGANDGASGVAVLLELARTLPKNSTPTALLFIDAEDNGRLPGWDWIQGSYAFTKNMVINPKAVIIVDMIGDADQNIYMEKNSDPEYTSQIWDTARNLGYETSFIPKLKYQVLDDHIPFLEKGIRVVDIIDLDYPYWHTTQDTTDKVSAASLKRVGDTLLVWIQKYGPCIAEKETCPLPGSN